MTPDTRDTIVAIASARAPGERGVVRLSGPDAIAIASQIAGQAMATDRAARFDGIPVAIELAGAARQLECDLLVWPDARSYTHQPCVEFHTIGSPPVLEALVRAVTSCEARLAEPGEFTLRAFLAGRIDLTQAEAVLAVIDTRQTDLLEPALAQLAGGLSGPLHHLREELLGLLADLEAGLDFVEEEDVRFVEPEDLVRRLADAQQIVDQAIQQTQSRSVTTGRPRVMIVGPPNVGKSQLFNALVKRFGENSTAEALVADEKGVTRDSLTAGVNFNGVQCDLMDTAGIDQGHATGPIDRIARDRTTASHREADLLLFCQRADEPDFAGPLPTDTDSILVLTMSDRLRAPPHELKQTACITSALKGAGIDDLAATIFTQLSFTSEGSASAAVANTAERCAASLSTAHESLGRAKQLALEVAGDELVSFEIRETLDAIGRVVGAVVTDDILDQVFSKFCIGK